MTNPFASSQDALWANMDDDALVEYSSARCRNRFLEWAFTAEGTRPKTKAEIYADLTTMRDNNEHRVLALGDGSNIGNIDSWATSNGSINHSLYGNWLDVAVWAKTLGITNRLYCQALRINSSTYMTLQEVFRRPT